ncbi:glycosyl hydrolase [Pelobium sp.]|nr:glycosyl hydrolase [Pelobium sp.]MDA9555781.1 glycosyl hydrolase [Pelobium sp.]
MFKKSNSFFLLINSLTGLFFLVFGIEKSNAQLRIYQGSQQTGTYADCAVRTIYTGTSIPGGLEDQIVSIKLTKGYMATLAENSDGSGNGYPFMAVTSDLLVDLSPSLKNKVSFIRVLPIFNPLKKGAGYKSPATAPNDNTVVDQLGVTWFYDWGSSDVSTSIREYALMSWDERGVDTQTDIDNYIAKADINHLLSFNEPDNSTQASILYTDAVPLHSKLLATGYRIGSPATQEQNTFGSGKWQTNFIALANTNNVRVDYIAIHWYDWGSYSSTNNTTPDVNGVFTRFKNYVTTVYNTYKKPIWITEFNSNPNTTSQTHVNFMNLAIPWLESQNFVERYAYFFPATLPPVDANGNLTDMGTAYKNQVSYSSIKSNMDGMQDTLSLEAENATLTGITTTDCSNSSGGKTTLSAISGTQRITFNNIFVASTTNYKLRVYYFALSARNITVKVNSDAANTYSIPVSGTLWCYQGGSAGYYDVTIPLNAGTNTIEFSNAPVLDRIQIIKILATTLPINLVDFKAEVKNYGVKLNWETLQEVNNKYFEVLRADDSNKEFKLLAPVPGAINSTSPKFYSYTDFNPVTGNNYYQLKQYDLDGKSTAYTPIPVKFGLSEDTFNLLSTSDSSVLVSISSSDAKDGIVSFTSIDGRIWYQKAIKVQSGLNTIQIPIDSKNANKMGIVTFTSGSERKSLKILR